MTKTQNLSRDIASRGELSSRAQHFQRNSTAVPTSRSFRAEIDPLTHLKMRKEDNWNKII